MSGQKITVLKFSFILKWPVGHVCPLFTWKDFTGYLQYSSLTSGLHPTINDVTTSSHVKYRLHALTAHSRASLAKYINNQWRAAPPSNAPESQINIAHANLFAIFCKAGWQWTSAEDQAWVCPYCASRERQDRCWKMVHKETLSWWDQTSYPDVPTPHWAAL